MTDGTRAGGGISLVAALAIAIGCAHVSEQQKAQEEASTKGKYAVRLTDDAESVVGTCKYIRALEPDDEPVTRPTNAQLPDYYRTKAVLNGADTVVVRGRIGEAYLCGPTPLNPDGTRQAPYAPPIPQ